jgi:AraC-like DNA-binding protein
MSALSRSAWPGVGARDVLAQRIEPTLHAQRWSLDGSGAGTMSRAITLSAGRGWLTHADGELVLRAPDVIWLPAGRARSLRLDAGSAGVNVGVSDALLAAAMGQHADAAPLRQVSLRLCLVPAPEAGPRDELLRSLLAIEAEARSGAGGSRPYLAAHLTLVLVTLWRLTSRDGGETTGAPDVNGGASPRLLRFRQLVEVQFRQHWPVARYAAELSISADRLHDLCVRSLGRAPLALVHQRVLREACSLLAGTDLAVERVAADLGFGSPSQFSRFFKRGLGGGPKAWRGQARAQVSGRVLGPGSYADWP